MGLAVGGEQAAIEAGQQAELRQLFRQSLPFFPGLLAEAGGARRDLGGGPWFRLVQAALAGVAAQADDVARQGLRPRIGVSPSKSQADDHQLLRQP